MRKHMEMIQDRKVVEGNRKLFICIEDYLTPRDAEESILPLPVGIVALRMRSIACAKIVDLLEWTNVSSANTFIIEKKGGRSVGA